MGRILRVGPGSHVSRIALIAAAQICTASAARAQQVDNPAESAAVSNGASEIVVTAQKRSESISRVPMSITAASGEQLVQLGVHGAADLTKIVPGFTYTETTLGTPVYTIRGIGYYDTSLSAQPAVSVYVDEVPLPYSAMTRLGAFDLERVEVLKGPQGTLFGSGNTGGAINYIAARPTDAFTFGGQLEFGTFATARAEAYASGPITSNLKARLAVQSVQSGDWQRSTTRPDDTLGSKDQFVGRLLLDWQPASVVSVKLNLTGWQDRSDTVAGQLLGFAQLNPAACTPSSAAYPLSCISPAVAASPVGGRDARAADWTAGRDYRRDDYFYLASGRVDIDLAPGLQATSLTAYSKYRQRFWLDGDATAFVGRDIRADGDIDSFFQELRVASSGNGPLRWIVGGNYQRDKVLDQDMPVALGDCSCTSGIRNEAINPYSNSRVKTYAAFANADYQITDKLAAHAGVRYTNTQTTNVSGSRDTGDGVFAAVFNGVDQRLTGIPGNIQPGGDVVVTLVPDPTAPRGLRAINSAVAGSLHEDNVSWRGGLDYTVRPGVLIYANVSRGYKAGSFPINNASTSVQYTPAKQETVLAYELGTKASLFDRALQLNLAGFYYNYSDKQIRGRIIDPLGIFGALEALVNVPKSRVLGAEAQAIVHPAAGLTLNVGATYLSTKITKSFLNYDPFGNRIDFKGERFPFTPKLSATADIQYEWPIWEDKNAFVGVSGSYQSSVDAAFYNAAIVARTPSDPLNSPGATVPGNVFRIAGYGLVDIRAGMIGANDRWRVSIWTRNLFDKYYRTAVIRGSDTIFDYAGMPRTVGVTLGVKY